MAYVTPELVEACYPRVAEFLKGKRAYDPECRFASDWYRHCLALFGRR